MPSLLDTGPDRPTGKSLIFRDLNIFTVATMTLLVASGCVANVDVSGVPLFQQRPGNDSSVSGTSKAVAALSDQAEGDADDSLPDAS